MFNHSLQGFFDMLSPELKSLFASFQDVSMTKLLDVAGIDPDKRHQLCDQNIIAGLYSKGIMATAAEINIIKLIATQMKNNAYNGENQKKSTSTLNLT